MLLSDWRGWVSPEKYPFGVFSYCNGDEYGNYIAHHATPHSGTYPGPRKIIGLQLFQALDPQGSFIAGVRWPGVLPGLQKSYVTASARTASC